MSNVPSARMHGVAAIAAILLACNAHAGNLSPAEQKMISDSYYAGCLQDTSRSLEATALRLVCRCEAGTVARETTREEFDSLESAGELPEQYQETLMFARESCKR